MSSKGAKKNVPVTKATNAITTRNKSAQQNRQLRVKNKKIEKPLTTKQTNRKTVTKSLKLSKNETCYKDTPLKTKVRNFVKFVEHVEYYPDKLKRVLCNKKIMLKPKHNFKVVAAANKRKLTTPQKGGRDLKCPPLKRHSSSQSTEMSMVDMVRLIEDTHSLSEEDFMEILTCPSPVWWEDPPDDGYIEDAICTRPADLSSRPEEQENKTIAHKNKTKLKLRTKDDKITLIDFENEIEEFKISPSNNKNEKFNVKKLKLENILGSIKSGQKISKTATKQKDDDDDRDRNMSHSTDGEDLSDISFNEEEVLKNLENMDIPIEQKEQTKINKIVIKTDNKTVIENTKPIKTELIVPDILPPLTRKPDIKVENTINTENSDSNSEIYLDNIYHSNFRFISDDDISLVDTSNGNDKVLIVDRSSIDSSSTIDVDTVDVKEQSETKGQNVFFRKKVMNDLSEYITVYKIMSHDEKPNEISNESIKSPEITNNNVSGKLNNFFKKRKSIKRLKKSDSSFPAVSADNQNSDEMNIENDENRLKSCDYCVVKTEDTKKEIVQIFSCELCNFLADTKEIYKKHVSSCKVQTRISWQPTLLTNQT